MHSTPATLQRKSHYQVLDGLRGVAAVMVVSFHICEAYANGNRFHQIINHGYLAVDFFFLLSGFVVAYAYDDRWQRMSLADFGKRRLIRLQPMVVMGTLIGAALFYLQRAPIFPLVAVTPVWKMLLVMLVGFTMVPLPPSADIRGWDESYPLNGPAWSLFYEYIANVLYALVLRRLSNRVLAALVLVSAVFLVDLAVLGPSGDVIGGWSLNAKQMHIGFARVLFPFLAGVLLMRLGKRIPVNHAFGWCSVLLVVVFSVPRIGGPAHLWMNGLYESCAILFVFPLVVAMGAGEWKDEGVSTRVCRFLGGISYPLYITHYPLIYVYTAWVTRDRVPAAEGAVVGALLLITATTIAWVCLRFYDEPLRRWLDRRFLPRSV